TEHSLSRRPATDRSSFGIQQPLRNACDSSDMLAGYVAVPSAPTVDSSYRRPTIVDCTYGMLRLALCSMYWPVIPTASQTVRSARMAVSLFPRPTTKRCESGTSRPATYDVRWQQTGTTRAAG